MRLISLSTVIVDNVFREIGQHKVRINFVKPRNGNGLLSCLTFIVSDEAEQEKMLNAKRDYKIIGEYLVWKDKDDDFFKFTKIFDQDIVALEQKA